LRKRMSGIPIRSVNTQMVPSCVSCMADNPRFRRRSAQEVQPSLAIDHEPPGAFEIGPDVAIAPH
jgi:hypothetical protein